MNVLNAWSLENNAVRPFFWLPEFNKYGLIFRQT